MEYTKICGEILEACRDMERLGLVYGTWGNISVRFEDGLIMTPSRISYDVMVPGDMVHMDFEGNIKKGHRVPTSERDIHRLILKNRPDLGAVVHTHSPHACAAAAAGLMLPPLIEEIAQLIGGAVPVTPHYIPGGNHLELAKLVVETLGGVNAVLIKNHGPVSCGASLSEALVCAQVTEKAAQMALLLPSPDSFAIPGAYVREERERFLHKYGKE